MSTYLNPIAARGAAVQTPSAPLTSGLAGLLINWLEAWRRAVALRRTLQEINNLSDRELTDIGLGQDEILRLRSSETFVPRAWRVPSVRREELPF